VLGEYNCRGKTTEDWAGTAKKKKWGERGERNDPRQIGNTTLIEEKQSFKGSGRPPGFVGMGKDKTGGEKKKKSLYSHKTTLSKWGEKRESRKWEGALISVRGGGVQWGKQFKMRRKRTKTGKRGKSQSRGRKTGKKKKKGGLHCRHDSKKRQSGGPWQGGGGREEQTQKEKGNEDQALERGQESCLSGFSKSQTTIWGGVEKAKRLARDGFMQKESKSRTQGGIAR